LPASFIYMFTTVDAPMYVAAAVVALALLVAVVSAALGSWKWSKLNATWSN
jgi:hypothetical protein